MKVYLLKRSWLKNGHGGSQTVEDFSVYLNESLLYTATDSQFGSGAERVATSMTDKLSSELGVPVTKGVLRV